MNKIFFVGDFYSNTGPAIVNKNIKKTLKKRGYYSICKTNVARIIELFLKSIISNSVCFCSFSKIDIIGIKFCKILHKRTIYLMHGCIYYESKINNNYNEKKILTEMYILNNVDKIICVSKKFAEKIKMENNNICDKVYYVFNGIDLKSYFKNINKNQNLIVSTGGGLRIKNNIMVCKAIKKINKKYKKNIQYIIIGNPGTDIEKIRKYKFVTYIKSLRHEDCLKIMSNAKIYIQNSFFETFGLSPIEALSCGCNLLISKNIGCIDILTNLKKEDLIFNNQNIQEISEKIYYLLYNDNNARLFNSIDKKENSLENRVEELIQRIKL